MGTSMASTATSTRTHDVFIGGRRSNHHAYTFLVPSRRRVLRRWEFHPSHGRDGEYSVSRASVARPTLWSRQFAPAWDLTKDEHRAAECAKHAAAEAGSAAKRTSTVDESRAPDSAQCD